MDVQIQQGLLTYLDGLQAFLINASSQVLPVEMQSFKKHYVYFAPYLQPEATAAMLPQGKDRCGGILRQEHVSPPSTPSRPL